jgi:hypothetical protein
MAAIAMPYPCLCRKCLPQAAATARLRVFAPRIALAVDTWFATRTFKRRAAIEAVDRRRAEHRRVLERRAHLDWLVAHRELQLVRATATGRGSYIRKRQRLLNAAIAERASFHAKHPGLKP